MRGFEHLRNFNELLCWPLQQDPTSKSPNACNHYLHQPPAPTIRIPIDRPPQRSMPRSSCSPKQEVTSFSTQRPLPQP